MDRLNDAISGALDEISFLEHHVKAKDEVLDLDVWESFDALRICIQRIAKETSK